MKVRRSIVLRKRVNAFCRRGVLAKLAVGRARQQRPSLEVLMNQLDTLRQRPLTRRRSFF